MSQAVQAGPVEAAYVPDLAKLEGYVNAWASEMEPALKQALLCCQFYDGRQLTDKDRAILYQRNQPEVIINRVKPAVNGIVGLIEKGKTDPKGIPTRPVNQDSANLATDVLRYIANVNRLQTLKSRCALDALKAGWTSAITEVDEEREVTQRKIRWEESVWDPASREVDCSDARFLGIAKWVYVDDLQAQYPELRDKIGAAMSTSGSLGSTVTTEDRPFGWVDQKAKRIMLVELYHREGGIWHRCKFVRSVVLEAGRSAYLDKRGRPRCPIRAFRAYVDTDNRPYGVILDMMDPQREINARRSWLLRALVARGAITENGNIPDEEAFKAALASTDGLAKVVSLKGTELIDRNIDIAGHTELLNEAKSEVDRIAPNPALQGRENKQLSGRASQFRAEAGMLEMALVISGLDEFEYHLYCDAWDTARQFYPQNKYIVLTQDAKSPSHLMVNVPVMDPATGMPAMRQQIVPGPEGPSVQMVPVMQRSLAELDAHVVIDSTPDVSSIMQEQFEALTEIFTAVAAVNPAKADKLLDAIIASSTVIRDKAQLLESMNQAVAPSPQQQLATEMEVAEKGAEIEKTESETALNRAKTVQTLAQAGGQVQQNDRVDAGVDDASQDREQRDRQFQPKPQE